MPEFVIRGQKGNSKGIVVVETDTIEEAQAVEQKLKEQFPDYQFTTEPIVHMPAKEGQ